ncbi:MAG: gamma-glutamyl-gamma-aminobutyrate hydrolase family protein [Verrucomicrobia subdivision 3 bacterium]|nr:gamma-glutamyl-gamma-aminobutyrate hydrolase family protein [Limisphaerales bacterium]
MVLISGSTEKRGVEFHDLSMSLSLNYALAIQAGGGLPWVLPCVPEREVVAESVAKCDGVLLTGGDDVQPRIYRDDLPPALARTVHPADGERDLLELMLVDEVFRQRKPLLAICRGHQVLNVALGGTLVVDVASEMPDALNHSRTDKKDKIVHDVQVSVGSLLAKATGVTRLGVNSSHHQAVGKIAKPLRITAVSIDGIIEGLELAPAQRHFLPYLLAVQFHPERLFSRHKEHLAIFESFVAACKPNRGGKL